MTQNGHANGATPAWELPPEIAGQIGALTPDDWTPPPGDALYECTFRKSGFRSYELEANDAEWRLVLSRVDVNKNEPRGLLSVYAPKSGAAFGDLDGLITTRSVSLQGATSVSSVAKMLHDAIGNASEDWRRRFDYLVVRTIQMAQAGNAQRFRIDGRPELPARVAFVFQGRVREGRTITIFGAGSSGKTTLVDGLVTSLGSGVEIIPGWRPSRAYRVAVLDYDEGEDEERVRLRAITDAYDTDIAGYAYTQMGRPLAESADVIGPWLIEHRAEVVIVSNVNRALRGNERGGDPGGPVHELYECLREFETTNILIDHVTGADIEGGAKKQYGSVAKVDNVRGSFLVEAVSEEPGRRVVSMKNKKPDPLTPRREDQLVEISYEPPWPKEDGTYDRITFNDLPPDSMPDQVIGLRETQIERLARVLQEHGAMTTTQICALGGFHAPRVWDIARRAREHGFEITYTNGVYAIMA